MAKTRFLAPAIAVAVIVIASVGARVLALGTELTRMDADTAIVELMAIHVAQGDFVSTFWGQSFGGTALSVVGGWVMIVTGPNWLVLPVIEIILSAGMVALTGRLAWLTGGTRAAVLAAGIVAFPGIVLFERTLRDPGFYLTSIVPALVALWLVNETRFRPRLVAWGVAGIMTGVATWSSFMGLALAAPTLLALRHLPRTAALRSAAVFGVSAAIGYLPALLARGEAGALLPGSLREVLATLPSRVVDLFGLTLPSAFPGGLTPGVSILVLVLVLAALAALAIPPLLRRSFADIPLAFLCGAVLLSCVLVGSGQHLAVDSQRYALFYLPALAIGGTVLVGFVESRLPVAARWPLVVVMVLAAVAVTVAGAVRSTGVWRFEPHYFPADMTGVIEALDDLGAEAVYAEYWYSYPIAAGTDERIVAADLLMNRYPPYRRLADVSEPPIVVVGVGSPNDAILDEVEGDRRVVVGSTAIHVLPEGIELDDLNLVPR